MPALSERPEDLPLLIDSLLSRLTPEFHLTVSPESLSLLQHYSFPGNIRELRNILERAALLADDDVILPEHLPADVAASNSTNNDIQLAGTGKILSLEEIERSYLVQVVSSFSGDRDELAGKLGISKRTLFRKLQSLKK